MTDRKHSIECYDANCEWCSCWCHQDDDGRLSVVGESIDTPIETAPGGATNTGDPGASPTNKESTSA